MAESPLPPSLLPVRFRTSKEDRTFDRTCNAEDSKKCTYDISTERNYAEEDSSSNAL